ncbi:MAG: membrane dipeptidase, partial [Oscillospiraceae bacterium]|nr:membrane dipeptidase [Oscillospiraceae bacterium]
MFTIDAHCDSVLHMHGILSAASCHMTFDRLVKGAGGGLQWMACFPLKETGPQPYELLAGLLDTLDAAQAEAGIPSVIDAAGLKSLIDGGSWGVLRSVEGGEALENDLSRLDILYGRGVRSLGLTWNHPNALS